MTTPLQFTGVSHANLPPGPVHLAIGMFDGVHLGHRATIQPAIAAARSGGGCCAVLTFWPHPSALFRPAEPTRLIQAPATKTTVLGQLGVDVVITQPFDRDFAGMPAEDFVPWLKQALPGLAGIYVGDNFRFGRQRRGDPATLRASAAALGIAVHVASPLEVNGEGVSSTRIRAHLLAGEIEAANALLGYVYFSDGLVIRGKGLGRTIGIPTLNVAWSPDLRPRYGVYVVRVRGEKTKEPLHGVANYGLRPTVESATEPRLEVHLLGDCPYDADDRITVDWLHFIRGEQRFATIDDLRAQIARDCENAEIWFRR